MVCGTVLQHVQLLHRLSSYKFACSATNAANAYAPLLQLNLSAVLDAWRFIICNQLIQAHGFVCIVSTAVWMG